MQHGPESSRKDSLNQDDASSPESPQAVESQSSQAVEPQSPQAIEPQFVEVAVPVHVSSTFIYRMPAAPGQLAQPGSRIVVPFGRKLLTGYIVAVLDRLKPETSLQESDVKEAQEILDAVPLVTPELLELTRWVAEYYLAPWGEVIKAALPPGISPTIDPFLAITANGRAELDRPPDDQPTLKQRLLQLLVSAEELSLASFADQFGSAQAAKAARSSSRPN